MYSKIMLDEKEVLSVYLMDELNNILSKENFKKIIFTFPESVAKDHLPKGYDEAFTNVSNKDCLVFVKTGEKSGQTLYSADTQQWFSTPVAAFVNYIKKKYYYVVVFPKKKQEK